MNGFEINAQAFIISFFVCYLVLFSLILSMENSNRLMLSTYLVYTKLYTYSFMGLILLLLLYMYWISEFDSTGLWFFIGIIVFTESIALKCKFLCLDEEVDEFKSDELDKVMSNTLLFTLGFCIAIFEWKMFGITFCWFLSRYRGFSYSENTMKKLKKDLKHSLFILGGAIIITFATKFLTSTTHLVTSTMLGIAYFVCTCVVGCLLFSKIDLSKYNINIT